MALPIDEVIPALKQALAQAPAAVLEAPPGAGKTTRVPLALLQENWLAGQRIMMLEPRRLAARMAADFMARGLGEPVGATVGYRVRLDAKVSAATRIEIVTEGILTRRLQADPGLDGIGLVIFDEFHERSLEGDLALALCRDIQKALRPDLKILVMSATLDGARVAALLDGAPVVRSQGRQFPVSRHHVARQAERPLAQDIAALIRRALAEQSQGGLLAFAPGEADIRRIHALLQEAALPPDIDIHPLYGALAPAQQDAAIAPAPAGRRKLVIATTIAETSLTIEDVRIVVDGGYKRAPRFDPQSGMTRLETVRVSRAAADQRCGRAGRLGPGACYRLWDEATQRGFIPHDRPEMLEADLAGLALDLALWGTPDPQALDWLDPPPAGAYAQAQDLLRQLGAIDHAGHITADGRAMAGLPLHPRLAHMVVRADNEHRATACALAALLAERDPFSGIKDADIRTRLDALAQGDRRFSRIKAAATQLQRIIKTPDSRVAPEQAGCLLALAYPDRIAKQRGTHGRYVLAAGTGAVLPEADPLANDPYLAIAHLAGGGAEPRIYLAAPISAAEIEALFKPAIITQIAIFWDARAEAVRATERQLLGALVLTERPLAAPDPNAVRAALMQGLHALGLAALPWSKAALELRARLAFLATHDPAGNWPDMTDERLLATLPQWLEPDLDGISRRAGLGGIDLETALKRLLDWRQQAALDRMAPTHVGVPSGRRAAIDYGQPSGPVLAVKLQEMFGATITPAVLDGRFPLSLHLLSPAGRPLGITQDLPSFWQNIYPQIRAEMRGRYPRHPWPDNPLEALPTHRAKPRGR